MKFLAIALLLGLSSPSAARAAADLSAFGFDQRPGNQLPMDVPLHDASGRAVRLGGEMGGRPTILVLGYLHCPNLCGVVRNDVFNALLQSGLQPKQYTLLVVSIDPAETSADAASAERGDLARYPLPGADTAWHYLTGPARSLRQIATAVGFHYRYDPLLKQFLHPAGLVFLSASGRISGYLLGVGYKPGDLALGVSRAGKGGIERAAVPVLLLCFHYDPATGRYTLAITKALQLAGLLTVLALGSLIGVALRHERSK